MADPLIRGAARFDLDQIAGIERDSFPAPWPREFFDLELQAEHRFSLVATLDSRIVGYLFAMYVFEEMHINKIAVDVAHRRRRIAEALMSHTFRFAKEHEIETLTLEVRETNRSAQHFYLHLGFERTHVRRRYYPDGEDAVIMTLRVGKNTTPL